MRESSKTALGGIIAALSVLVMLVTYISPLLVYTAPPFAGILLIVILEEINVKTAFATYSAISILSVFLIADKESAVFYVAFFGYYPILRKILTAKIVNKYIRGLLKTATFNLALLLAVSVCAFVFNIDYSEISDSGTVFTVIFWVLMNFLFVCYDFLLSRLMVIYTKKLQYRVRKILKH